MKVSVIGCGRWGSFIAWYLARQGMDVTLYGRKDSARFAALVRDGRNEYVNLSDVRLTSDLSAAARADVLAVAVSSGGLRAVLKELSPLGLPEKKVVLCMKGVEETSGKRLSEVMVEQ